MYQSLEQFLQELPAHAAAHAAELKGHDMSAVLETKQGRRLCLLLREGAVTLPDAIDNPDCTATTDEKDLLDMINGKLHPMKAVLTRRIVIKGDVTRLLALIKLV